MSQEGGLFNEIFDTVDAKPGMHQTISTDGSSYFVVKNNHSLWGWGYNQRGQLGIGTKTDIYGPQQMEPILVMENVKTVSTSGGNTLILKTDGTLWACGSAQFGALNEDSTVPIQIMNDVAAAISGDYFSVIKTDGSLWTWGRLLHSDSSPTTPIYVMNDC